jgi:hypothetical protein
MDKYKLNNQAIVGCRKSMKKPFGHQFLFWTANILPLQARSYVALLQMPYTHLPSSIRVSSKAFGPVNHPCAFICVRLYCFGVSITKPLPSCWPF